MLARGRHGGPVGVEGVVVDAPVQRVGHLPGIADQQRVPVGGAVGAVGGEGVGGHGHRIPGVQAVVGAIPADSFAQPVASAVAQRQRRVAFFGVAHPPDLGKPLRPRQIVAQLLEHAAARPHRGQLVGITHQHGLGAARRGGGQQLSRSWVPTMRGLIDDDQRARVKVERTGARAAAVPWRPCRPASPAPSRIATSTAFPVGASTSTSLRCARCAAARSA